MYPVKIGETLILDFGKDVNEWKRNRNGIEDTIKPCTAVKQEKCGVWIRNDLPISRDGREHMYENGTLIIENFQESDSGDYFSNDELERIHYTADGQIWKLGRSRITVFPVD
ncbi:unnamed protein product [Caenorhabditis sp. 36 PRJEB53466]|nr:unnamed protein product [Caenorhabditis sp. 36 PRJEB53466]